MAGVSINDVALDVGVSKTTVSHALSGRRPVSSETLKKVQEATERLGYRPSQVARALRERRTQTIALIVPDLCNPFYPALARGLQEAVSASGYASFVCDADSDGELEAALIDQAIERQVDGIVIAPLLGTLPSALLAATHIPKVVISSSRDAAEYALRHPNVDTVSGHDELGMRMAAEHLIRAGHRRIGFINAPVSLGPAGRRFEGFTAAMQEAGLPVADELMATTSFTRAGGAEGITQLLEASEPPTAVLCANDLIAIGVMDVAHERGIGIPDELAVVGYDDIDAAALVSPALTTVRNPTREMGKACGSLLLDRMTGSYSGSSREVRIGNDLVIRRSA
jgi:DNA-binding LacI/PurR family transcriptional regulator